MFAASAGAIIAWQLRCGLRECVMQTEIEESEKKGKVAAMIVEADLLGMVVAILVVAAIAAYLIHGGRPAEAYPVLHQIPYPQ
jgi:hypothetical protein